MKRNTFFFLKEAWDDIWDRPPRLSPSPHTAKFGNPHKILRVHNTGFCLTGLKRLSRENSHKHTIAYGVSGSGKSTIALLPSLFTTSGSIVVFDPSGELYASSATAMAMIRGYVVKRLNFSQPLASDGFNPLAYASNDSEINKLSELIITIALGNDPKARYWNESSIDLLRMIIRVVQSKDAGYHTFAHIYHLLSSMEASPEKFLQMVKNTHQPQLITHVQSFLARDAKLRSYIITNLQAALQRYSDPNVAQVSSFDSVELHRLRERPTIIYVQVPPQDHEYYRTPNSVFWEILFGQLMKTFSKPDNLPVYTLIDEAGWLNLPNLPTYMAVARKHFGILLAIQNAEQLEAVYGVTGRATIEANAWSKLFFHSQSPKIARDLSRSLGFTQVDDIVRPLIDGTRNPDDDI